MIVQQPQSITVDTGLEASFSVVATGSAPLRFQWLRNGKPIAGATTQLYVIAPVRATDDGAQFAVQVSNPYGFVVSSPATLSVHVFYPPVPTITMPALGTLFQAGQTISYSGSATDPQDGVLSPAAMSWEVDFVHGASVTTVVPLSSGNASGSFTIPTSGLPLADGYYRIVLTAADDEGLSQSTEVDLHPQTATLTVTTNPSGVAVSIDGQSSTTPFSFASAVGMSQTIVASATEILGGTIYHFAGWSDGISEAQRVVVTPASGADFLALYQFAGIVPPVTVRGVREKTNKGLVSRLIVTYSGLLDAATATSPSAYWIVLPGRDRRFGTRDDRRVRVRAAVYNRAAGTVTLTPRAALSARQVFQVVVSGALTGASVKDVWERPIDGDGNGQPGGNAVITLRPARAKARPR
jgi:hypothetical protein